MSSWKNEFSEAFAIPAEIDALIEAGALEDVSWHNNVCPSFILYGAGANGEVEVPTLWIDHPEQEKREIPEESCRFLVLSQDGEQYAGNDLQEALSALRAARV